MQFKAVGDIISLILITRRNYYNEYSLKDKTCLYFVFGRYSLVNSLCSAVKGRGRSWSIFIQRHPLPYWCALSSAGYKNT